MRLFHYKFYISPFLLSSVLFVAFCGMLFSIFPYSTDGPISKLSEKQVSKIVFKALKDIPDDSNKIFIVRMMLHGLCQTGLLEKAKQDFLKGLPLVNTGDWFFLSQIALLKDAKGEGIDFAEILKGAHVLVVDGGNLYKSILHFPDMIKVPRDSSHESKDQQYGLGDGTSHLFPEILLGTTMNQGKKATWFQMERNPLDIKGAFEHLFHGDASLLVKSSKHYMNFFSHLASGNMQIGPYGMSKFSEKLNQVLVYY